MSLCRSKGWEACTYGAKENAGSDDAVHLAVPDGNGRVGTRGVRGGGCPSLHIALAAQMATTFLNLVLVGVALLSGTISRHFGRRKMCAGGMLLFALAGICGAFFTVGLWAVFVWSAFLGAGDRAVRPGGVQHDDRLSG